MHFAGVLYWVIEVRRGLWNANEAEVSELEDILWTPRQGLTVAVLIAERNTRTVVRRSEHEIEGHRVMNGQVVASPRSAPVAGDATVTWASH